MSVKATPVNATVLVFCTVMVRVVVPPTAKVEAVNALVTTGAANTVRLATAVVPVRVTGPVAAIAPLVLV